MDTSKGHFTSKMLYYLRYCEWSFQKIQPNVTSLTLLAPISQNGQTHSNNSLAVADELFECVWPFCGIGALRDKVRHLKDFWPEYENVEPLITKI